MSYDTFTKLLALGVVIALGVVLGSFSVWVLLALFGAPLSLPISIRIAIGALVVVIDLFSILMFLEV